MNKRWLLTIPAASALLMAATSSPAVPAVTASAAAPSSTSSASALPAATGQGTSLDADPPSAEVSKEPKLEEWKTASVVKLARGVPACSAYRVREWLKIHCTGFPGAGVTLLAGSRDGVQVWVDPSGGEGPDAMAKPRDAEIVFPVRRGDGRLFQIAQFGEGYDGPIGWNNAFSVSEYWVDGEPAPIVSVR